MGLLQAAGNQMAFFKCGILGFSGSGKTYTATLLAEGICKAINNMRVAYFDTETGSDFLIAKLVKAGFKKEDILQVKSRSFSDLLTVIQEAEQSRVGVLIIDSITHVWRDLCDSYDRKLNRRGRLQFQDWSTIKGEWRQYTDAYVNSKLHIIVCGRAGYEYDYDFNEDGSKDLVKTDIKMKVESEFGFEPSLVLLMERTSETREEVKQHMGKTDFKSKAAKQQHKPEVGSKWIHRCYVLKDRTDTMNGDTFDYPTFESFRPHFDALNIGGEHLGVDTSRTSEDRFDVEGKPQWKREQEQRDIALEEIEAEIVRLMPGQTAAEKKAKLNLVAFVFGTASWTAVRGMKAFELQAGLKRIRDIASHSQNTPEAMSSNNFVETPPSETPFDAIPQSSDASSGSPAATPPGGPAPGQPVEDKPQLRCDECGQWFKVKPASHKNDKGEKCFGVVVKVEA